MAAAFRPQLLSQQHQLLRSRGGIRMQQKCRYQQHHLVCGFESLANIGWQVGGKNLCSEVMLLIRVANSTGKCRCINLAMLTGVSRIGCYARSNRLCISCQAYKLFFQFSIRGQLTSGCVQLGELGFIERGFQCLDTIEQRRVRCEQAGYRIEAAANSM